MSDNPLFPQSASTLAGDVDALCLFLVAISVFFSVGIAVALIYLSIRFRWRKSPRSHHVEGSIGLELLWSGIPLLITLVIFGWGAKVFFKAVNVPNEGMTFLVTGKQWMWKIQHPTGQKEINSLHVPVGQTVILEMTSEDVIHSFFVPAFRMKQDVLPGMYTRTWFHATKVGTYHLFCAEYCGAKHSKMIGQVVVMEPRDYQQWLTGQPAAQTPEESGKLLFEGLRCNTCHENQSNPRGPTLVGIYGREVELESGESVVADDEYLRESILEPAKKLTKGYESLMPTYQGQVSEEQIRHLIAFLKSRAGETGAAEEEGE